MPFAPLSGVNLYYELHGPPEAPPLVLLHGACETFHLCWGHQIAAFSKHHRVIGVDLRGHGQSDNPADALDLRRMADDVYELLGYLGYTRAHVCGFSGGASTALFFAVRHTQALRSLVLISNNMQQDQARTRGNFWDVERIRAERPHWWEQTQAHHRVAMPVLLRWWAEEDPLRPNFTPAELQPIVTPTLVMGGDRDPIVPLDQTLLLYRSLPNAQLAILPRTGHGAPNRPALFNPIVLEFLARARADERGG